MRSAWYWINDSRSGPEPENQGEHAWRWIKESQADNNGQAFRGNGKLAPDQEEIRRLKIEDKQLKLERQILKEAAGIEAKETK